MKSVRILPAIGFLFAALGLGAQDFSGSIEARLGWYWNSTEILPLTQVFSGGLEGKVGSQDFPAAQYSATLDVSYDPATNSAALDLGETWIKFFAGPFDISAGNQVLAWGSTDVFTPSDVVNPLDLTLPVDPIKKPVPLGRIVYNGDNLSLDLVVEPFWIAPSLPASPWAAAPALSPTINAVGFSWDNVAYGGHAKLSLDFLQGLDLGITAYRGRSYTPTATVNFSGSTPASISLDYDRLSFFGAEAVLATGGDLLLKADWGYRTLRDTSIFAPEAGAASAEGVSGFEYRIGQLQLIGEYVLDWAKGSAAAGDSLGHSIVGIATMDLGSRVNLKVAATHEFTGGSGLVAPEVSLVLADGLKVECDMFFFYGGSATTYGAWKDNSLGRLTIKQSF